MNIARTLFVGVALSTTPLAFAQIPDLLTAFDAGGRALGVGGALGTAGTSTRSILDNPAGIGFASEGTVGLIFRNLSESRTRISGNFRDPDFDTRGDSGNRSLTHAGIALPLGKMGVLGVSYQLGGYIRERRFGTNLQDGQLQVRNYQELTLVKTDFITVSLARARQDFSSSWGVGLVFANNNIRNTQTYQLFREDNTQVDGVAPVDNRGSNIGIGAVVGYQVNTSGGDRTLAISARTPISLRGGGEIQSYYNRIPGKISVGGAQKINLTKRADDFAIMALQGDYYFGGSESGILNRDERQIVVGGGIEYNYKFQNAYLPIRLGYRAMSHGGDNFTPISGFTFGLGYSPIGSPYNVDIDFASNSNGGMDMSLSLTYRISR